MVKSTSPDRLNIQQTHAKLHEMFKKCAAERDYVCNLSPVETLARAERSAVKSYAEVISSQAA